VSDNAAFAKILAAVGQFAAFICYGSSPTADHEHEPIHPAMTQIGVRIQKFICIIG